MMNMIHKIFRLAVIFILILGLFPSPAFSDGMAYYYDNGLSRWELQGEKMQAAAINHSDGVQNMIISINAKDLYKNRSVWIFPVPARPESTKLNITSSFPDFSRGIDIVRKLKINLREMTMIFRIPLIVTLPSILIPNFSSDGRSTNDETMTIYKHEEEKGLTAELVGAVSSDIIFESLKAKGFEMPPKAKDILKNYPCDKFIFVVTWVSNIDKLYEEAGGAKYFDAHGAVGNIGLQLSFPSKNIYFPLVPTSIYGEWNFSFIRPLACSMNSAKSFY